MSTASANMVRAVPMADEARVASLLYAAKPVTWRGRGGLHQFPWQVGRLPRLLVLDLWSGIRGLCVALL